MGQEIESLRRSVLKMTGVSASGFYIYTSTTSSDSSKTTTTSESDSNFDDVKIFNHSNNTIEYQLIIKNKEKGARTFHDSSSIQEKSYKKYNSVIQNGGTHITIFKPIGRKDIHIDSTIVANNPKTWGTKFEIHQTRLTGENIHWDIRDNSEARNRSPTPSPTSTQSDRPTGTKKPTRSPTPTPGNQGGE